jgi:hypothetical protein
VRHGHWKKFCKVFCGSKVRGVGQVRAHGPMDMPT